MSPRASLRPNTPTMPPSSPLLSSTGRRGAGAGYGAACGARGTPDTRGRGERVGAGRLQYTQWGEGAFLSTTWPFTPNSTVDSDLRSTRHRGRRWRSVAPTEPTNQPRHAPGKQGRETAG